jgi:hypothetical protein
MASPASLTTTFSSTRTGSPPATGQYVKAVREYVQAGFTHVALVQVGAERQHDFIDWSARELLPALREL